MSLLPTFEEAFIQPYQRVWLKERISLLIGRAIVGLPDHSGCLSCARPSEGFYGVDNEPVGSVRKQLNPSFTYNCAILPIRQAEMTIVEERRERRKNRTGEELPGVCFPQVLGEEDNQTVPKGY